MSELSFTPDKQLSISLEPPPVSRGIGQVCELESKLQPANDAR
jgi:hypothetical protein